MQLEESHIMVNNNGRFGYEVMKKTKGEGVNVIINYVTGIESYTDTVNYTSEFSNYIETVQHNLDENYEIGDFSNCHIVKRIEEFGRALL